MMKLCFDDITKLLTLLLNLMVLVVWQRSRCYLLASNILLLLYLLLYVFCLLFNTHNLRSSVFFTDYFRE